MHFKIKSVKAGGHIKAAVFVASGADRTFASCGTLCMTESEARQFLGYLDGVAVHDHDDSLNVEWWPLTSAPVLPPIEKEKAP